MAVNGILLGRTSSILKTITLSESNWTLNESNYIQNVTVSGISATETEQEIHITSASANMSDYIDCGIYASAQAVNAITFTASKKPTIDLTIYIIIKII